MALEYAGPQAVSPRPVGDVLAYDITDPAPTSYGSFWADAVHIDESGPQTEISLSLSVENRQIGPIDAPKLDRLRVVNTDGAEGTYLDGGWRGDPTLAAGSTSSADFRFAPPAAGGMLILEHREPAAATPIRIAVGYARPHAEESTPASDSL